MQEAIESLSSEGGLARIKELTELQLEDLPEERAAALFSRYFLPFFHTVSHPSVLASHVLEKHVGTIYNYLYGHGGHRALSIYKPLATMFVCISDDSMPRHVLEKLQPDLPTCLGATIAVLAKIVDINGTANVNDALCPVTEVLTSVLEKAEQADQANVTLLRTRQQLSRIQQRLGLGQAIADTIGAPTRQGKLPSFHIERDGPGWLSEDGPRHDNDFEDICKISILPTSEEILCSRKEYLPVTDPAQLHIGGIEGLIDRHFRLLREDTVGQLRDAIRLEVVDAPESKESKHVARTHSYQNLECIKLECHQWKGLRFLVSFDQPAALQKSNKKSARERQEWWIASKRLQPDSLVCILSPDGAPTFCTVVGPFELENDTVTGEESSNANQSGSVSNVLRDLLVDGQQGVGGINSPRFDLGGQTHRAYAVLRLAQHEEHNSRELFGLFEPTGVRSGSSLIAFPGVLLPAFRPTLQALQEMSAKLDIPFADVLAPSSESSPNQSRPTPPVYAMDRNFRFDLSCLLRHDQSLTLSIRDQFDLEDFRRKTSLDKAQASAVVDALTRNMALIQGPPGTGKSFTGVALVKVLLQNAKTANIGPIICVCFTNHALDQLLEQFLAHGIEQIIRIGSQSKSDLLQPLTLQEVMKDMDRTRKEGNTRRTLAQSLSAETENISGILEQLGKVGSSSSIEQYLQRHHSKEYWQLFGDEDEEGFTFVYRKDNVIDDWLAARHPKQFGFETPKSKGPPRAVGDLCRSDIFSMSTEERYRLYRYWVSEITDLLRDRFVTSLSNYHTTREEFDQVQNDLKLRCLQQANIIGLTTTGLARNISLLRKLHSKVLVCEEAGEVLEAHLLTALLPSIEHAIFIGDPQQLRPQIQNYELSMESSEGKKYSLDMSLFERLIQRQGRSTTVPYSVLETQRRMHPSISRLVRETLYPMLKDATSVQEYPEVTGMRRRLFWLDHTHAEADQDENSGTSHTNSFEVETVAALVSHLVRQSVYQPDDIAVLTPYLGQLHQLRRNLASRFEITMSGRDIQGLEAAGLEAPTSQPNPEMNRTTLLQALRIATIDNFQGEEAKVVVISLVRSNPHHRCGFLKTSNRINVLLSRAKHGMYIIGNSQTSSGVRMWHQVLQILKEGGNHGPELELQCPRHPETPIRVSGPDDFLRLAPEGGCNEMCAQRLPCGHKCKTKCHSVALHNAVVCLEPCTRSKKGCDHVCPKRCGEPCDEKCRTVIDDLDLTMGCGHRVKRLPCWQVQDPSTIVCTETTVKTVPHCAHEVAVNCSTDVTMSDFRCNARCESILPCGHACHRLCHQCRKREDDGSIEVNHGKCHATCDRPYATCSHRCQEFCHGKDCPPCQKPCEQSCIHSKCAKQCSEPCAPCAESSCSSQCPHASCTMPCAAPCDWIPCSRRCEKALSCGHRCKFHPPYLESTN